MKRTWTRMMGALVAAGVLAPAVAGCAPGGAQQPEGAAAAAPSAVVTYTARDFAFEGPAEIPAGRTAFRLVNAGQTLHHMQIIKLDAGKTMEDFHAAMRAGGPPPAWMHEVGGPNAPDPGGESNATVMMEPGEYLVLCFVDTPDRVPHVMKGMIKALRVTGPMPAATPAPAADVVMTLNDYSFALSKPLAAGRQVIRVENGARQPHEVEIIRLAPGKTLNDLMGWMESMQGPPPASAIGGVAAFVPEVDNTFTADLAPGDYVLICFVPDAGDGKPHFMHGMVQAVTVS
ncbi:MAG TPA: hypothetical protein VEW03_10375 [Longimicrobiaceae bacterium]|nr:hypothetical protein [Longimicrobiaceae bacterium]